MQVAGRERAAGLEQQAAMSEQSLRRFYEEPLTPLALGEETARYQGEILAGIAAGSQRRLRAIDVGCGDGSTAAAAVAACRARGAVLEIIGFDWSATGLAKARRHGLPVARASVEHPGLPLASASVDLVVMSELIEHVVDTDAVLAEARRVLVPGGRLVLSTPNLAAWFNRVLLVLGVQPLFSEVSLRGVYGRPGREVAGHLRLFTRRALVELLAANGFGDVRVTGAPYHDVPPPFRTLDRLLCHRPGLSSILLASARRSD
jgi:SAM-dependent methyltransferase